MRSIGTGAILVMLTMTLASCAAAGQTTSATVAASTASSAGSAPTPSPSPVFSATPESLIGTWAMIGGFVQTFDADGRYRAAGPGGAEVDRGTYTFDGERLSLDADADAPDCEGTHAEYLVTFKNAGNRAELSAVGGLSGDPCANRRYHLGHSLQKRSS